MIDHLERHADKLLREWEEIQHTEFWKALLGAWDKAEREAINFTLSTKTYESILRSRGEVDGIRLAVKLPERLAEDIKSGKKGQPGI